MIMVVLMHTYTYVCIYYKKKLNMHFFL